MSKIRNATYDMGLNIIATVLPSVVLQVAVLPFISRGMTNDSYGVAIAAIALLGFIPLTAGNVINNVRLLNDSRYKEASKSGDYSIIVAAMCAAAAFIVFFGSWLLGVVDLLDLVFLAVSAAIMLSREYLIVEYRLCLNYKKILIANIILTVGFVAGAGLFCLDGSWSLVYFVGYGSSLVYVIATTTLWSEPFVVTPLIGSTVRDSATLGVSGLLNKATTYVDRLILIPLMGSGAVAVYYAACLFGKMLSLIVSPINSVMLSYLVKENKNSRRAFFTAMLLGGVLCVIGYFATLLLSEPILSILYPQFVDQSMLYLPVVTAAAYLMVLSNIANPFVMRFGDLKWQIVLNGLFCTLFFTGCLVGFFLSGLFGFCLGTLFANASRLALTVVLYLRLAKE